MSTFAWKPLTAADKLLRNLSPRKADLDQTANLVHNEWEMLDPTPDINSMFRRFDDRFFSSKLRCVDLEWSKRMYSCAGICYMRKNRMGQAITIRLSEPLLKLRPRKDLVQTLLHEMIHAVAFIKGVREGNGGHGPFFHKMKDEINKVAGTNISVYHTFHDEVNVYKKHVWRCNGICKERKPFFGYVRRVSNRAPGPNDQWWATHQSECGGRFNKIGEPEKVKKPKGTAAERTKKPTAKKTDKNQPRISDVFAVPAPPGKKPSQETAALPKRMPPPTPPSSSSRFPGSHNIRGFPDLSPDDCCPGAGGGASIKPPPPPPLFQGKGNVLTNERAEKDLFQNIQEQVRDIWQKRFANGGGALDNPPPAAKRPRVQAAAVAAQQQGPQTEPNKMNQWQVLDGDLAIRTPYVPMVDLLDSDSDGEDEELRDHNDILTQMANKTVNERKTLIEQELLESEEEDEIVRIDDEFDDTLVVGSAGQSRGASGGGMEKNPRDPFYAADDVVKCPICEGGVARSYLMDHMEEGCTGIRQKVPFVVNKGDRDLFGPSTSFTSSSGGGGASTPSVTISSPPRAEDEVRYPCPNCGMRYGESRMNDHLDQCLS